MSKRVGDCIQVMSLLGPDDVERLNGIPPEAQLGTFTGELPERLNGSPAFVALMHGVIRRRAPESAELHAAARAQRDGYLYVIDANTPDGIDGEVPPEDVIGAFKVDNGTLVEGYYFANEHYVAIRMSSRRRCPAERCPARSAHRRSQRTSSWKTSARACRVPDRGLVCAGRRPH